MTLRLLCGKCWTLVCPPSVALRNVQNGCIPGAVHGLLLAITYPQSYTKLRLVHLVSQDPRGLPDTVPRTEVLTY